MAAPSTGAPSCDTPDIESEDTAFTFEHPSAARQHRGRCQLISQENLLQPITQNALLQRNNRERLLLGLQHLWGSVMAHASDEVGRPSKEELFELVVASSLDIAIFTVDTAGIITSWNVGAERLFGHSEAEMLRRSSDLVFVSEDRAVGVPAQERSAARTYGRALDERCTCAKTVRAFGRQAC